MKQGAIPGLVPGTHALPPPPAVRLKWRLLQTAGWPWLNGVGGRDKPGHDDHLGATGLGVTK
jgi:hypothetical protein